MTKRKRIEVDKKKEMRSKEISKMIGEGGLGADNYYKIVKDSPTKKEKDSDKTDDEDDKK